MTASLSAVVFVARFFGALHGEELVQIDFRRHWSESVSSDIMYVSLMLSGRFKREVGEINCQPLSWTTQSGVEIGS